MSMDNIYTYLISISCCNILFLNPREFSFKTYSKRWYTFMFRNIANCITCYFWMMYLGSYLMKPGSLSNFSKEKHFQLFNEQVNQG